MARGLVVSYIQTQFRKSSSSANFYTGITTMVASVVGIANPGFAITDGWALDGYCPDNCKALTVYLAIHLINKIVLATGRIGGTLINLRTNANIEASYTASKKKKKKKEEEEEEEEEEEKEEEEEEEEE
ncbi:hypothetical protein Anas_07613 [Armadillidium nasatum]|uniref:Uncharacterized protein n=1 Tax=Armadillidium nasatum TaxID=96803 RepID=A0A5N5TAE3_9CRUS|nr:hypothetical protein Anas_07613 [Armadillidium nasatum]